MKKFVFFLFMPAFAVHAKAQIRPLSIGDTLPSFTSAKTINCPAGTINLDNYKGKLLILDFWASYCGGCTTAFPKLHALQQKYPDQVAIVVVTWQKQLETEAFWRKNKIAKNYLFPVITEDSILKQYFPFASVPHIAWIAPDGRVKAITEAEYVTEKNIELVLDNKVVRWPVKTNISRFDLQQSLMTWDINAGEIPSTVHYSAFTGALPSTRLKWGVTRDSIKRTVRISLINCPIPSFYSIALQQTGWKQIGQRMIYKVKDSSRLFAEKRKSYLTEWDLQNRYCYEAVYPAGTTHEQMGKQLIDDANRFSGFRGHIAREKVDCWVISKTKKTPGQKLDKSVPLTTRFDNGESMANIIASVLSVRVVNEVKDCKEFPVITVQGEEQDINKLNKRLGLYGLQLKKKKRKMEVFVVEEK